MTKSLNYNHLTGEIIERNLTLDEIAEFDLLDNQIKTEKTAKETERQAVLDRLGITSEEAKLILGGSN